MTSKTALIVAAFLILLASCKQTDEQLLGKAYEFSKNKKYDGAIEILTEVINRNDSLQLAYYNRGIAYMATKKYHSALLDFNKVLALQTIGDYTITYTDGTPFSDEKTRAQVPYNDALYTRAQAKYFMDSLASSFTDFQSLVERNYQEKSNCVLWQGTILLKSGKPGKACVYFDKAKKYALTNDDAREADQMIEVYCGQKNISH